MTDETCAYRHCKNTFQPQREHQRFCSRRCRHAYAYDIKRAEKGLLANAVKHRELRRWWDWPAFQPGPFQANAFQTRTMIITETVALVPRRRYENL